MRTAPPILVHVDPSSATSTDRERQSQKHKFATPGHGPAESSWPTSQPCFHIRHVTSAPAAVLVTLERKPAIRRPTSPACIQRVHACNGACRAARAGVGAGRGAGVLHARGTGSVVLAQWLIRHTGFRVCWAPRGALFVFGLGDSAAAGRISFWVCICSARACERPPLAGVVSRCGTCLSFVSSS